MSTFVSRTGSTLVGVFMLTYMAQAAPATRPAATQPATTQPAAAAPTTQPGGFLSFEPMPGGSSPGSDFQGMGNMKVPATRPAFCQSDNPQLWHETTSRYKSALLFDESGGTGTGYDTLYVSFDGNETFAGEIAKYKPVTTDVSAETLGRNFEMDFQDVNIMLGGDRPPALCKITFRGNRNQDDPESKFTFGGRLYPPQPVRRWAVGTLTIEGKTLRAALVDENTNGRFTDRGGLNPPDPNNLKPNDSRQGDVLLLAVSDKEKLDPNSFGQNCASHIPLPEYLVLNSGTYQVKLTQSDEGVSVRLVPVNLPAGTVEFSVDNTIDPLVLSGTKTAVLLTDPPEKVHLPADFYAPPNSSESPYEVEAEEGVTAGLPFPKVDETAVSVLLPDGSPAAGAEYVVTRGRGAIFIEDGHVDARMAKPSKTGEDGKMSPRRTSEGSEIVVVHEGGWAHVTAKDAQAKKQITLTAWGAVEGTLRIGSKVGANEKVSVDRTIFTDPGKSPQVSFWYHVTTDDKGHFSLSHCVTGEVEAGWHRTLDRGSYTTSQNHVTVEPGKTATVTVGGVGRPVIGRVHVPEEIKGRLATAWLNGNMSSSDSPWETMSLPRDWMEMSSEQQQNWRRDYLKEHTSDIEKSSRHVYKQYRFGIDQDGSFRIEDVTAGKYGWSLAIQAPQSRGVTDILAHASTRFDVPEMEGGRSDEPLDLGTIPLKVPRHAAVGEPFPLPEVKDIHDKPLKMADFAGRYVLVYLHDAADAPKWVPPLKAIWKEFGDRLTVVSLYYEGKQPEDFAAYLAEKGMDWPQAFADFYEGIPLVENYRDVSNGVAFLVGPDGKLLARQAQLDEMRTTVQKALAGELKTPTTGPASQKAVAATGEKDVAVSSQPAPIASAPAAEAETWSAQAAPAATATAIIVRNGQPVIVPASSLTGTASPSTAPVAKPKAFVSDFVYSVPDVPKDSKANLVFRKFPVEFSEEQCDQRIVPWAEASPRPAFCKSGKALTWETGTNVFRVRMLVDESRGTGTGYDTLYVDPDAEGDFTGAKVHKASKFTGETGVEGGKVIAWFENIVVTVSRLEGTTTAHVQVFLQEPKPGTTDAGPIEGWAIPQNWAVGTASIGGAPYPVAMLDRNWNDKLTDNAGFLQTQYPHILARGDYLILGKAGEKTLTAAGTLGEGGSTRLIRTDTFVMDSAIYQTAVEQTDEGVGLRFQPARVPTGKVRLNQAPGERLVLLGASTSVILAGSSKEFTLPEDTYLAMMNLAGPPAIVMVRTGQTSRLALATSTAAGMSAEPFEVKMLDGKALKLEDYRGRYVVLTFWASWAKPCLTDIPHLKAVCEQYGKAGKAAVIGLNMDDDADTVRDYLRRNPLPWPQAYLDDAQRADIAAAYGVDRVPMTFLIDPQGRIVSKDLRGPAIQAAVTKAMAGMGK